MLFSTSSPLSISRGKVHLSVYNECLQFVRLLSASKFPIYKIYKKTTRSSKVIGHQLVMFCPIFTLRNVLEFLEEVQRV